MKIKVLLIFLVGFSISVQNTCPFGLAGKIGFIPKEVRHCSLKEQLPAKADTDSAKKVTIQTGQTFVFIVGNVSNAAFLSFKKVVSSLLSERNLYKNIYSEPPVKPPPFV